MYLVIMNISVSLVFIFFTLNRYNQNYFFYEESHF